MKFVACVIIALAFTATVQAKSIMPKDAISLSHIDGRVIEVNSHNCPEESECFAPDYTTITFAFTLNGCVDELGLVDFTTVKATPSTGLHLAVSAINIGTEASENTNCFTPKVERRSYTFQGQAFQRDTIKITYAGSGKEETMSEIASSSIYNPKIEILNGGINPDAFAYKIQADVLLGSNSCRATGISGSLLQEEKDGDLHIKAVVEIQPKANNHCTMEYAPVYQRITLTIRGFRSDIGEIIFDDVGHDKEIYSLEEVIAQAPGQVEINNIL